VRTLKFLLSGVLLGLLLGLWFGYNLGRDEPVFSNPFAEKRLQDKVKETASSVLDETTQAVKEHLK